jgi:hypothetical protein
MKNILNEGRLIKASGGVTARLLKITNVIVFSRNYCAKGVIFSLVWIRLGGEKKGQSLKGAFILINLTISDICYSELVQNVLSLVPSNRFVVTVCS